MYWKSWEIAFQGIKQPQENSPLVSNWLDEAFSEQIFQWDTIFMMMFARYGHNVFPAIQSLDNFYAMQRPSGYIGREYREKDGQLIHFDFDGGLFSEKGFKNTINPPLFAWAEMENFKLTGDSSRLRKVLPVLEKYAQWLHQPGTPEAADWENNGRWSKNSIHQLFWNTPLGSGMDNTPRPAEEGFGWVEMSSQMVIMYHNLAELCNYLEEPEKENLFRQKAQNIGKSINRWCWNDSIGFYFDVRANGSQFYKKTSGGFWPLLAGICTEKQAARLVAHLQNPREFWRPIVFPTLAADEAEYQKTGGYWQGGVWAPTNVMIIKGLEKYGYHELAKRATEKYLAGMVAVFQETGTLWENYAPEQFKPGDPAKADFVGWTGCGPIQLLIENVIGIKMNCIDQTITWDLHREDRHGVEKLSMGEDKVSLICGAQKKGKKREISILTETPFELIIRNEQGEQKYAISSGTSRINIPMNALD
jgi:glycogen debranching enzyme